MAGCDEQSKKNCQPLIGKNMAISVHFPRSSWYIILQIKIEDEKDILKITSGFLPDSHLSIHTTSSSSQIGVTIFLTRIRCFLVHSSSKFWQVCFINYCKNTFEEKKILNKYFPFPYLLLGQQK
jgi:hypothetical protein